ncbi:procollagen-lysine,2-oxoglutarate 5-dioxygenase isoform X2 [Tribolium castaneum]|uniref:procollagen-lysine,2-oxoglutarate 5-dioxygenase isoform X2 n=1 Tax=Tribolium castaneum TaxID=7070 RepID=UPI0001DCC0A4|nr:PREDICTED: procollagen-lysine,2-oxoglutarate 5-dioxygenase 1 isoform X2 [Tribolium castaneum]|eukprot:XP_015835811.1 PREDICTED: procollagen-lysine,2-oxoglutarate 5-dioxygenase 1 isoform X2 [Tribolium castaneum]
MLTYLILLTLTILATANSNEQCIKDSETCGEKPESAFLHHQKSTTDADILVFTVASEPTDGFQRYLSSAHHYHIAPTVLGFGQEWKGGSDIKNRPGGGWKINLLKTALEPHKDDPTKIILFTDGYDVIFTDTLDAILRKFKETKARVLFGAESSCWPDVQLAPKYPQVTEGKRFLNSGLYMGYAPDLWQVLTFDVIEDTDDDQLFFTKAYLDEDLRKKVGFKLDHKSEIFQNLNGAVSEVELFEVKAKEGPEEYKIQNVLYHTVPLILHGNGPSKLSLNYLGNYLANSWNSVEGCVRCKEGQFDLKNKRANEMSLVLLAIFVEFNTPFLEEMLSKVYSQEYPKHRIDLFIHNAMKFHSKHITDFIEKHGSEYRSVKDIKPDDGTTEWAARDLSLAQCLSKNCDIYFSVDSVAHLDNPHTLRLLIEQNRTVVAPLLPRPGKAWSNFWGDLTKEGFYARSNDYMDIVHNDKRGLWNVPFIANCYAINATLLKKFDETKLNFDRDNWDADMAFCANLRDLDVFMYVSNRVDFGHLVNPETFDITRVEPEMYQIFDNEQDWEARFIHPEYPENFNPEKTSLQPCPDVYWFPIVSPRFCTSLINMMENFGKWSDGSNKDPRLEGGYEAVPTRDIHMNQVGWEKHWLEFLRKYVRPLQEHVFLGYFHDPPRSLMNFVVRYKPDEQPSLRPHHDSSTYTINIALNQRGVDYEGGGCRFIRYNCSVVDTKLGWLLIHPGRLTHYHEGLKVTKGIRYIMIAFVDP